MNGSRLLGGFFVIIFHPLLGREMSENSECRPQMLTNEIIRKGSWQAEQELQAAVMHATWQLRTPRPEEFSGMKF